MQHSTNRILTTHAGSLPRPRSLITLHTARFAGTVVEEAVLEQAVEEAARAVIARQIESGLDIINNGEMGRESFFTYLQHRMTGFGGAGARPIMADLLRYPGSLERRRQAMGTDERVDLLRAPKAIAAVRYVNAAPIEQECRQLRQLLGETGGRFSEAFVSAPSPGIIAAGMQNEHYEDLEAYVNAVAEALRTEYTAIAAAGFLLQIDAPDLALERHTLFQDKSLAEFLAFVRVVVAATNRALAGIPREQVRLHVCWGNYEGPHDCDVPLEDIWPDVSQINAGAIMLSMANPRHAHEYHLFEEPNFLGDRLLIPGVIETTTNYVEHPQVVADRIERIARAAGDPRRIIAGTDCGFETAAGSKMVVEEVVWAKLRSLAEGAAIASKRLLG
ncbi:MAG: cobalamin-independent methionine synthase II family protein [Chloroflexi bacterium]|nr:cobalamin-independent methionine synthase II family protein [Chloroflexota bacterium]MCI0578419.1 cobalamin-independent methionine synthase II family protein [Chloroflexota bacterium]MCI0648159.1 cobalamin-independent methionine synthase II family protein [Chloroflexota bacterium]MCI0726674.1 cobalamin-independent methionine synthase II family protein [Chloroflexota bacterium]